MSNSSGRDRLIEALSRAARELGARTVLFHEVVAERLGLNATALKCLDLVSQEETLSAGQLAELTGLTTGAITGVIDRLEEAGFVQRERDRHDRRRVIIRPRQERIRREIAPLYGAMSRAMTELAARYDDEELALVLRFISESIRVAQEQASSLRQESGEPLSEP